MSIVTLPPSQESGVIRYASGFWRRFVAYIIDLLIIIIPLFPFIFIFGLPDHHFVYYAMRGLPYSASLFGYDLLGFIYGRLYFTLMECSRFQATFGKIAMGIIVVDEYGRRISFGRANGRYFAKVLSI